MNRRKPMTSRQLVREKLLFRYSSALERGDFEVISAVLREAENDPVLERMLHDMNDVYRAELAPPPALPSFSTNHNHRSTREDAAMTVTFPTIRRVTMPAAPQGRWASMATLAAAIIAIILFAAILIARRPPNPPEQANPIIGLQNETATPIPSPTWTPTPVPQQPTLTGTPTIVPVIASPIQDAGFFFPTLPPDMPIACQGIVTSTEAIDGVNVFSDSSSNGVYIGRIALGTAVDILSIRETATGGWYYVRSDAAEGWMGAEFVILTTSCLDGSGQPLLSYPCGAIFAVTATHMFTPVFGQSEPLDAPYLTATAIVEQATAVAPLPPCQPNAQPTGFVPYPTPTAVFDLALRSGGYDLMTTEQVGDIPANARVRINSAQFDGSQWLYDVVAKDGQTRGLAYDYQLQYAPGVTPGAPTPTAIFGSSIGMGMYSAVTTQPIGDIPEGVAVRIGSAWYNGVEWIYQIQDDSGRTADNARESQLRMAASYEPGMPTPTAIFFDHGNVVTLEQIGDIPANTLVQTTSGYYNGMQWVYTIVTLSGNLYGEATDSQLRYATASDYGPGPTPGPTSTPVPIPT
jgi:hypothetical protein